MITVVVKNVQKVVNEVNHYHDASRKALNSATKGEGFRMMRLFQKEIREAAPGGRRFKAPTLLNQARKNQSASKSVLNVLAYGVKYLIKSNALDPIDFRFGWVGPQSSKSYKRLAQEHQEGFTKDITDKQRRYFRYLGFQRLWGRSKRMGATHDERKRAVRVFFLRDETREFNTPARPMRDPFWQAHQKEVMPNIKRNFKIKMEGGRF